MVTVEEMPSLMSVVFVMEMELQMVHVIVMVMS